MEIKAADVAKLRKMTGAGMMDCKNALVESDGDFDRAQEIIREKGKLVAAKRADRETTEGSVIAITNEAHNKAILVCLGCETDFVAKNQEFQDVANGIAKVALGICPQTWIPLCPCVLKTVPLPMPLPGRPARAVKNTPFLSTISWKPLIFRLIFI
jgi:translation elongation factor Ts